MAEQDPSRGTEDSTDEIILDVDTLADVQRGVFKKPEFFGDMSSGSSIENFTSAVQTAAKYINFVGNAITVLGNERQDDDTSWQLTLKEYNEIKKLAYSIADYGRIPYQTIVDFLIILCSIDNLDDMIKIADILEIDELKDQNIIRVPFEILAIRELYKIAYMASALDAIINLFSRFIQSKNNAGSADSDDIGGLISNIGNLLGGLSGGAASVRLQNNSAEDALGHFMSELIEGKRIPMAVIAKNPMKEMPSYIGQALFGESPTALSLMDMNEIFNKKIAVFPKPSSGSGKSSFGMQNFSSLKNAMNIKEFVNKVSFGGSSAAPGSYIDRKIDSIVTDVKGLTGVLDDETFTLNSADVAIPLQIAMSACNCGTSKSPFSSSSFQNGWQSALNVSNHMQNNNSGYLKIIRGLS
ncbi:MAG: hypothetical protein COA52_00815 [Hyphomicrobiales bacterium]|nr:MAG: hypothetical protein COA52_00815 [Hyphomicrobiales bacterium]